jgi:hypothetical protein
MSDPHGTEPLSTRADEPPAPPFDQQAVDAVSDADASLTPELSTGPQGASADATDLGHQLPAPQYTPPGGYATPHPPQGAPARGYSSAPPTQPPAYPQPPAAPPGYAATPGYPTGQGYPTGSPGYPSYSGSPQRYAPEGPRTNTYAIASLICSLAGLVTGISVIPGIVLGHIALNRIKETGEEGRSLAIAGLAVGYGLLAVGLLVFIGSFAFIALMGTMAATSPGGSF